MFQSRRGITPLVATVLLVAFSIGLGTIVMSWGEEYIEQRAEFARGIQEAGSPCASLGMSLIKIGGLPYACQTQNTVEIWLDNGANYDIANINARLAGRDGVYVEENALTQPLLREQSAKISIAHQKIGQLLQVRLTPKLIIDRQVKFCEEAAITIERLPPCP